MVYGQTPRLHFVPLGVTSRNTRLEVVPIASDCRRTPAHAGRIVRGYLPNSVALTGAMGYHMRRRRRRIRCWDVAKTAVFPCGAGESMRRERSSGFLSKDWEFFIALELAIPAALVISGGLIPILAGARQGDLTLFWIALASALAGIVLLFVAKWPLYRQRKYFTFGSKGLREPRRKAYWTAYACIGISLLTTLLLWAVVR